MPAVAAWSWVFLVVSIAVMLWLGIVGQRRVRDADDYAVARRTYGPLLLALAFGSTTASGATYLGLPALAFQFGVSTLWIGAAFPISILTGLYLCRRALGSGGDAWQPRSIPEFVGRRYDSPLLQVVVAIACIGLTFLLAAQLVSGLVVFERLLGLPANAALALTVIVLGLYLLLGGAHADILTDAAQAVFMLVLTLLAVAAWLFNVGADAATVGVVDDPAYWAPVNPASPAAGSWWDVVSLFVAYLPFGFLPYLGNKLWALRDRSQERRFFGWALVVTLTMPLAAVAGLHAHAVFGAGFQPTSANSVLIDLFVALLPAWAVGLIGAGVLASILSTADGLVISLSQVVANDLYRCRPGVLARWWPAPSEARVLAVSRWATIGALMLGVLVANGSSAKNVVLLSWVGLGGLVAGLAAPIMLGAFWRGATRAGALAGFLGGAASFGLLHAGLLRGVASGEWGAWIVAQAPNPYACATLAIGVSLSVGVVVSLVTERPQPGVLRIAFGKDSG